ncbi:MAG: hypothetical protein ACRD2T_01405 [Thermoanaerobaculia bacterium]
MSLTLRAGLLLAASGAVRLAAQEPGPLDPAQLAERVAVYVQDLEEGKAAGSGDGLKVAAVFAPDAFAYKVAREYLKRRRGGEDHAVAVAGAAGLAQEWKKHQGMAAVVVKIENSNPRPAGRTVQGVAKRRIYTLEQPLAGQGLSLIGPREKPIAVKLAEPPANLRAAQLRVKKFWTTADGQGRRGAYDPDDPSSIGRKPLLSKPFPGLLLEEKPAEVELLCRALPPRSPREDGGGAAAMRLVLREWKRYEGPFEGDQLDLNGGRRWEAIEPIGLDLRVPPGGLETPRAVAQLVAEVRGAALPAKKTG